MIKIRAAWEESKERYDAIWGLHSELLNSIDFEKNLEDSMEEIYADSEAFGAFLFPEKKLSQKNLRILLETWTDMDTLKKNGLIFQPEMGRKPAWTTVKRVFNYKKFSCHSRFAELISLLGIEVCPYCNLAFTSTVKKDKKTFYRTNQADHYMSKDKYPYLALTLPNLIPVCAACNNHKSNRVTPILYPYKEGFDNNYRFVTHSIKGYRYLVGEPGSEDDFTVAIEKAPDAATSMEYDGRVNASRTFLGLDVLYTVHNAYVRRIFEQRYVFGEAYIDDLCKSFPKYFTSPADVREMLYMKSIGEQNLGAAPLSKLTADIDAEITRLTNGKIP